MPVCVACCSGSRSPVRRASRRHRRFGDAEVGESRPAARVEQDVARFQIAVNDPTLVRVFQGLCNFEEYRNDFEEARAPQPAKIAARGKLHGQNHCFASSLGCEHFENGRMVQEARDGVLVLQRAPRLVRTTRGIHHLEGDVDSARSIVRAPNFSLPARAQLVQERIARIELLTI
jgi:hypothetical protein